VRRHLAKLSVPFREPFVTSAGVLPARELLLLRIEDDDGAVGFGEAAPFEPYDGVSLDAVAEALANGAGGPPSLPQARAAEEMALLDLEARRAGRPIGEPGDAERVAAVREAIGPWPALRVDANGAWTVDEAVEAVERLARHDLQLVEQPCRSLEELAAVREAVRVPVAADESVATADDVRAAADAGACDAVNVKLAASGGFQAAREALAAARENGLEPYLSSTLDGPWGIAAALQLAASERLSLACGLATLDLFDAALARALPGPRAGLLAVPQGPGLGVSVDDEALAEVLVEELEQ